MAIQTRLMHAWNAFTNKDPTKPYIPYGGGTSYRPDRIRSYVGNEKYIITAIYNQIAVDISNIKIQHVKVDNNSRYLEDIDSTLNRLFTLEANIDQTGPALIQDLVMSLFDEGVVAVVPIETTLDITTSTSYEITNIRVCKILQWYPQHVLVRAYDERTGLYEDLPFPKSEVAIIENPFFSIMNEPNSTFKRLVNKLQLLDVIDEQSSSGKLDIIIQLPYTIKTELQKERAKERRQEIEMQLAGSKYGIAYTDGTEKITQLNRPAENNLMAQIEYLTSMLYSQLGMPKTVWDGSADEETMLRYYNRLLEPVLNAIVVEFRRKFLTKTAQTQGQTIMYFRDPFKLVPVNQIADIADKFTRNEIFSSNDIRAIVGYRPSSDPRADELRNKNLNEKTEPTSNKDQVPVKNIKKGVGNE